MGRFVAGSAFIGNYKGIPASSTARYNNVASIERAISRHMFRGHYYTMVQHYSLPKCFYGLWGCIGLTIRSINALSYQHAGQSWYTDDTGTSAILKEQIVDNAVVVKTRVA